MAFLFLLRRLSQLYSPAPYAILFFFFLMRRRPPSSPLFPYTPLFRSVAGLGQDDAGVRADVAQPAGDEDHYLKMGSVPIFVSFLRGMCRSHLCTSFGSEKSVSSSRSEEHTSELQSLAYLVCRLLLEKK